MRWRGINMILALQAATIFDGERLLKEHAVLVEKDRVLKIIPAGDVPGQCERQELSEGFLAPGFVDIQVNGGGGVMLNNAPSRETLDTMTAGHRSVGTTSIMPTVLSDTPDILHAGVDAVREARRQGNAGILGIHIEGPFFDTGKRGTHKASMIRSPQAEDMQWLCSLDDLNVIVTLAPEHVQPGWIKKLADARLRVCAGHTNASYEQIKDAVGEGLQGFTHVFNAMSPLTARKPGAVGAALECDETWAGIIADGHHVHPASINIAHRAKPAGKLMLVSDAMSTVGSEDASFELYGERIKLLDGRLVNSEGALAGSAIGLIDAVRYVNSTVGLSLEESLRMASLYPAAFLGLDEMLGRIASGYRADFVHFDSDFRVINTWVAGVQQSHTKKTGIPR